MWYATHISIDSEKPINQIYIQVTESWQKHQKVYIGIFVKSLFVKNDCFYIKIKNYTFSFKYFSISYLNKDFSILIFKKISEFLFN